jgi:hypothetical protein
VNHVKSGVIEVTIHHLALHEVVGVVRLVYLLDYYPQLSEFIKNWQLAKFDASRMGRGHC